MNLTHTCSTRKQQLLADEGKHALLCCYNYLFHLNITFSSKEEQGLLDDTRCLRNFDRTIKKETLIYLWK